MYVRTYHSASASRERLYIATPTNKSSDPSTTRRSAFGVDLETRLFKQGWCGGGILVVDLCPRTPPLRRRLLQRQRGAWKVVQERMQIVVFIDDICKMMDRVLVRGTWMACMVST